MTLRSAFVLRLALALALLCPPSLALADGFPTDRDVEAAKSAAEHLKKAYEFGKDPGTEQMLDTAITAMSVGYPPAGAALGAMKGLMSMLGFFSKPDMVAEALKHLTTRLQALEDRVKRIEDRIRQVENQQFRDQNLARVRELQRRNDELKNLVFDLKQRPTDPQFRRSLANRALTLADSFLMARDADLWSWSDLDLSSQNMIAPDFKPLPTFESYVSALVFWMAALQTAADGDRQWVVQTYGGDLERHAAFLSMRAEWDDLSEAPETLPENVASRVTCEMVPLGKYPEPGTRRCFAKVACTDRMARRSDMTAGLTDFLGQEGAMCTLPTSRFSSQSETWVPISYPAAEGEEQYIEDFYGTGVMGTLASMLRRVATTGTPAEPFIGSFDMRSYTQQFLYGVKPDGTLVWFNHVITEDRNPPQPERTSVVSDRTKASTALGYATREAGEDEATSEPAPPEEGETRERGVVSSSSLRKQALGSVSAPPVAVTAKPIPAAAVAAVLPQAPAPRISHSFEGGKSVGSGWAQFREVYPAGGSGIYALAPDGRLLWYRHDGWQGGTVSWKGPVQVGSGFDRFRRIVPAADGILYAIEQNGDLRWYRENDYQDAKSTPSWQPVTSVGNGWGHFVQVFSTGEGVVYAVQPDGTLLWYRHTGYLTGAPTWEGPRTVGTGWQNFAKVFSPGEGHVYALRPTGELLWYRHAGYETGAATWEGPVELTADWGGYTLAFMRMWGTQQGPVVR